MFKTLFIKKGKRFIGEKCNKTCCKSKDTNRFLQYIFHSTKKVWKNETNHKFETPQPVSQETTFKNGHFEQGVKSSETKRLAISIDLTEAYLHIPIFSKHQKFLRFCVENRCYQWKTMCFGPTSAPQVFTKMVSVIAAYLRTHSVRLAVHLDDWLFVNRSKERLLQDQEK